MLFRSSAEEAIRMLNGTQIGGQNVRLSWGRSPQNKQVIVQNRMCQLTALTAWPLPMNEINPNTILQAPQQDASNQINGNYYGYQQSYEGYGYGAPNAQDPSMQSYYGYPGYGNYEQQQPPQQQQLLAHDDQQQAPPQEQQQQQSSQQPPQQVTPIPSHFVKS